MNIKKLLVSLLAGVLALVMILSLLAPIFG